MSRIEKSTEVNVPVSSAYNQWTQFESFPQFMEGVESVTQADDAHLHWRGKVGGEAREWDAEITEQQPDRIGWGGFPLSPQLGRPKCLELIEETRTLPHRCTTKVAERGVDVYPTYTYPCERW